MAISRVRNLGGINLYVNPLNLRDGDLLRSVNMDSYPFGAKRKRSGYETYLGTADGSAVKSLFSWTKDDGTTTFLYRASGSSLYYSTQGTGAWTLAGNGTITAGATVRSAVLDDTLIICDGAGSTRHTTNGTSFTDTTLAPVGVDVEEYQGRIYLAGTASNLFYSTTGTASDWSTDSSSLLIPNAGKLNRIFVSQDRLVATKNSGRMYRWDGFSLVDMATDKGPSSPESVDAVEGYYLFLNREGINGYGGGFPERVSNSIQPLLYNNSGSAVTGSTFDTAPAAVHRDDYLVALGTTTDDIVKETINDCVVKYDIGKNEFLTYQFADFPTSFHSFVDTDGNQQLIFGSANGQVYKVSGTATDDNGTPISSVFEYVMHLGSPDIDKKWNEFWGFFNPGCQANIQVAISNTFTRENLKWKNIGSAIDGIVRYRFPQGSRGRLLFIKVTDSSTTSPFTCYGFAVDVDPRGIQTRT